MENVFAAESRYCVERSAEEAWLEPARHGQPWALEQFYRGYHEQVYALCFRLLGRADDAQDAMQTAFMRAFRELPRFRGQSSVKTWIYRIALNESLGMLRKRRDGAELDECQASTSDTGAAVVEQVAVRSALARLKADHRAVLVLRFWEGLSYEEIGEVLGISLAATKMRLSRARDEFRRRYQEAR
ncbi:MAG: RNA polymerase sigma factor [Armatimonadota bacterium]